MAAGFDRQIRELAKRTPAYHEKCAGLWTNAPPPPHLGAPFLFAYVWNTWSAAQRRALVAQGRDSVEKSISQMLCPAGGSASPRDTGKMTLLCASCVPELFQEELHEEVRPMATLLSTLWGNPAGPGGSAVRLSKAERAASRAARPKHVSPEMGFIDSLPFVWSQPTLSLIEHTLQQLDYRVFDAPASSSSGSGGKLSAQDNELYQRDLLLSLRAFWLTYFGLQVFMALSPHFHTAEELLLSQARAANQREEVEKEAREGRGTKEQKDASAAHASSSGPGYSTPIHRMRIEDITAGAEQDAATSNAAATAASVSSAAAASSPAPSAPAHTFCACCLRIADSPAASSSSAPPLELKRCGRCRAVWYCSVTCQKQHFKKHKASCAQAAAALAATGASSSAAHMHAAVPAAAAVASAELEAAHGPSPDVD